MKQKFKHPLLKQGNSGYQNNQTFHFIILTEFEPLQHGDAALLKKCLHVLGKNKLT
ncbi:15547_t:CDS:1, partial [Cetraspora pellucida]